MTTLAGMASSFVSLSTNQVIDTFPIKVTTTDNRSENACTKSYTVVKE